MDSHVRLLICNTCKTTEQLPDFVGPPEHDDTLTVLTSRHSFPDGTRHLGQLLRVESKHWESKSTRRAIENQIRESAGHTGFDTEYYATKNTFAEDAMACWRQHNRTANCDDYRSHKKLLMPDTAADRKAEGVGKYRSNTYLCNFCPVQSLVTTAARKKAGAYK